MDKSFKTVMEYLFGELKDDMVKLEAEIFKIEDLTSKNYKEVLSKNSFAKFKEVTAIMSLTSRQTKSTIQKMHNACISALKNAETRRDKKAIQKIIKDIRSIEKQGFAYAERLPFSLGSGWKGENKIGVIRAIMNLPGYLLLYPFVYHKDKRIALYNKYLSEFNQLFSELEKAPDYSGDDRDKTDVESNIRKSIKDLKIFIRIIRRIFRSYKRALRDSKKQLKVLEYVKIDGADLEKDNEDEWEAIAA